MRSQAMSLVILRFVIFCERFLKQFSGMNLGGFPQQQQPQAHQQGFPMQQQQQQWPQQQQQGFPLQATQQRPQQQGFPMQQQQQWPQQQQQPQQHQQQQQQQQQQKPAADGTFGW